MRQVVRVEGMGLITKPQECTALVHVEARLWNFELGCALVRFLMLIQWSCFSSDDGSTRLQLEISLRLSPL